MTILLPHSRVNVKNAPYYVPRKFGISSLLLDNLGALIANMNSKFFKFYHGWKVLNFNFFFKDKI